jgi:hypothetical protein
MRSMRVPYRQKRNLTTPFELCEARESLAVSNMVLSSTGQRITETRVIGGYPQKMGSVPLSR